MPAEGGELGRSMAGAEPAEPEKLSERLNHLAASLLKFAQDRLDLLRWELAQEGARISAMLVRGFCAALLALFTLQALAMFVIAASWNTAWRLHVIAGVMFAALAATLLMFRAFQAKRTERSALTHTNQVVGS